MISKRASRLPKRHGGTGPLSREAKSRVLDLSSAYSSARPSVTWMESNPYYRRRGLYDEPGTGHRMLQKYMNMPSRTNTRNFLDIWNKFFGAQNPPGSVQYRPGRWRVATHAEDLQAAQEAYDNPKWRQTNKQKLNEIESILRLATAGTTGGGRRFSRRQKTRRSKRRSPSYIAFRPITRTEM